MDAYTSFVFREADQSRYIDNIAPPDRVGPVMDGYVRYLVVGGSVYEVQRRHNDPQGRLWRMTQPEFCSVRK